MRRSWSAYLCLAAWTCVLAGVIATYANSAVAQSEQSQLPMEPALPEVTVTATRVLDHKALARAVSSFVESHAAPTTRINQIGRLGTGRVPEGSRTAPTANDFVARAVLDVARGVGAPVLPANKKCDVDVEIVFTPDPQGLLDHVAKLYRHVLGYDPKTQAQPTMIFNPPIQAWYETGTRSMDYQPPVVGFGKSAGGAQMPDFFTGLQLDTERTVMGAEPSATAGSHIAQGKRSEFAHVLIIANSAMVSKYPLQAISGLRGHAVADTDDAAERLRAAAEHYDLLASGCAPAAADSLTSADRAYLKALYGSNLEQGLNLEKGDVRERMIRQVEGK